MSVRALFIFALASTITLMAASAMPVAAADEAFTCRDKSAMNKNCPNVATAQKDALYTVMSKPAGAEALELTARPLTVDTATALVQVFEVGSQADDPAPKLIGTFSFFPAKVGKSQTFILPTPPAYTATSAPKELNLSIKLVAANASRTLKDSAVEIVGARLVKD